ncbi:MAG TPA: hypothetical protein TECP_01265 [Hyphomicrobiaceae bacterium MAG_BT-2024]
MPNQKEKTLIYQETRKVLKNFNFTNNFYFSGSLILTNYVNISFILHINSNFRHDFNTKCLTV